MSKSRACGCGALLLIGSLFSCAGCGSDGGASRERVSLEHGPLHAVTIHEPYAQLGMNSGERNADGKPARVACVVCHEKIAVKAELMMATQLEGFHQGIEVRHGDLTCQSCHAPPRFEGFKLASGEVVSYTQVLDLCTQCHGQRRVDYDHGAHGGMNGYWDLKRGPRLKNHCLDCHYPHDPSIHPVVPAPHPRYRFLEGEEEADAHGE